MFRADSKHDAAAREHCVRGRTLHTRYPVDGLSAEAAHVKNRVIRPDVHYILFPLDFAAVSRE